MALSGTSLDDRVDGVIVMMSKIDAYVSMRTLLIMYACHAIHMPIWDSLCLCCISWRVPTCVSMLYKAMFVIHVLTALSFHNEDCGMFLEDLDRACSQNVILHV